MKYLIVVEKTATGFSAYSPDVPGCVSTGRTEEETEANMKEAIEFHVDGFKQEGLPVPRPSAKSAYVEISARKIPSVPLWQRGKPVLSPVEGRDSAGGFLEEDQGEDVWIFDIPLSRKRFGKN